MTESKTPRTDALAVRLEGMPLEYPMHDPLRELVELARDLERELTEKTAKVAELEKLVERLENELMGRE